jgi:hypothetical protein
MAHLLIHHRVEDFATWKAGYDDDKAARDQAGLKELHILQGADDPNFVALLFEVDDAQKAHDFIQSDALRATMDQIGAAGERQFFELT